MQSTLPDAIFFAFCIVVVLGSFACTFVLDPISAKAQAGEDLVGAALLALFLVLAILVATFDRGRLQWGPAIPSTVCWGAIALLALVYVVRVRAMRINTFFSGVVVIQSERGHGVIDQGPYGVVRHPGNATIAAIAVLTPVCLGSWLALIPAALALFMVLRRTWIEDRYLLARLDGYSAYAERVRYRLLPLVY